MKPWLNKMLSYRDKEYRVAVLVFTLPPKPNNDTAKAYKVRNPQQGGFKQGFASSKSKSTRRRAKAFPNCRSSS